jgi:hypothetical protein
MIDKSMKFFLTLLFALGGTVILTVTWMKPMPLTDRIVPSIIGAIGILVILARTLVIHSGAVKVRITNTLYKTGIKKKHSITL